MGKYVFIIGPSGRPIRYPAAMAEQLGLEILTEEEALQLMNKIDAPNHLLLSEILFKYETARIEMLSSLFSGAGLTHGEAMLLSTRTLLLS